MWLDYVIFFILNFEFFGFIDVGVDNLVIGVRIIVVKFKFRFDVLFFYEYVFMNFYCIEES